MLRCVMSEQSDRDVSSSDEQQFCANCGTLLTGPYCSHCGQSADDIRRPIWHLLTDLLGNLFAWEGKFLTTLIALFRRPGQVARAYVDGKRQSYTAPIRMYLIVSVAFFVLMSLGGVRVVGVDITPDAQTVRALDPEIITQRLAALEDENREAPIALVSPDSIQARCGVSPGPDEIDPSGRLVLARDTNVTIELFEFGDTPEGRLIPDYPPGCNDGLDLPDGPPGFGSAGQLATESPELFENRVSTAATQSLLIMVIAYAGLNLLMHPRRRVIEHVIYSLYWHIPFLSLVALLIGLGRLAQGSTPALITIAAIGAVMIIALQWQYDRGFYGSSRIGAALRCIGLQIGYTVLVAVVALVLILLSAL